MKTTIKFLLTVCLALFLTIGLIACTTTTTSQCEHSYDNACDTTCNLCSEERSITHTPNDDDGDCTTEITCSICKATTTPARQSHTGGTATCTEKAVCTVCGTAYGTVDANNHVDENTDHICDRECGKTDIGTHADSDEDNDHVCDYGCGATLEDHKGGTATCVSGKICEICGVEYDTTKNPNNHASENYTYTDNGDGTHTKACACGASITEDHSYDVNGKCICGDSVTPVGNLDELKTAVEQGGKILLTESIDLSSEELGLYIYTDSTVDLNGKTLTGDLGIFNVLRGATLTILGDGTLSVPTENCAIGILNGTVNITGGVIEGCIFINEEGKLNIRGGQVRYVEVQKGICTISGGMISELYNSGTCTISGGTFGIDPTEYVDAENYTVTNNGDGTWTVIAK